jgi:hypothetical protein
VVLGLGLRYIEEGIYFRFDLLYIMSFGRFGRKKGLELGTKLEDLELGVT